MIDQFLNAPLFGLFLAGTYLLSVTQYEPLDIAGVGLTDFQGLERVAVVLARLAETPKRVVVQLGVDLGVHDFADKVRWIFFALSSRRGAVGMECEGCVDAEKRHDRNHSQKEPVEVVMRGREAETGQNTAMLLD